MVNKLRYLVGGGLVLVLFGGFFYSVLDEGVGAFQYYHTLGELDTALKAGKLDYDNGVRLNGSVLPGSIRRDVSAMRIDFVLTDGKSTMPVTLNRLDVSDLFKDNAQVVLEGRCTRNGTFEAEQLLAKCPTKYESAGTAPHKIPN